MSVVIWNSVLTDSLDAKENLIFCEEHFHYKTLKN